MSASHGLHVMQVKVLCKLFDIDVMAQQLDSMESHDGLFSFISCNCCRFLMSNLKGNPQIAEMIRFLIVL